MDLREVSGLEEQTKEQGFFSRLSESYFRIRSFERSGRFHRAFGARLLSKYLPTGGSYWIKKYNIPNYVSGKRDLNKFVRRTKVLEGIHFLLFFASGALTTGFFMAGNSAANEPIANVYYGTATVFATYGLLMNLLPIMSQRYNRDRTLKLIERIDERKRKVA